MEKEKVEHFRKALLELREKIEGDYERTVESSTEEFDERAPDPNDEASRTISRRILLEIGDKSHNVIKQIDDALERIESGNYGECEECEEDIPEKRLELLPYARYCVDCKEALERQETENG